LDKEPPSIPDILGSKVHSSEVEVGVGSDLSNRING